MNLVDSLKKSLGKAKKSLGKAEKELGDIENSTLWRALSPLRSLIRILKSIGF